MQCGKTVSCSANITFAIVDLMLLYNTLQSPESTLGDMVKNKIALYLHKEKAANLDLHKIEDNVLLDLQETILTDYGIDLQQVRFTNYAVVDTFRLIQDQDWNFNNPFFERK